MAGISNAMPDQVFSPSLPILAKPTADFDHVSQLLTTIVTTENAQVSVNTAYDLTDLLLNSVGPGSLLSDSVLDFTRRAAADKKSAGKRQGAMFITGALFERFPPKQPLSEMAFLVQHPEWLHMTLDALADKTVEVRDAAQYALNELLRLKAEPLAVGLLPALMGYLSNKASKWQGNVGAFGMLDSMAKRAIEADDEGIILREALGGRLESLIPYVEAGMHDLKPEVAKQALKTMNELTKLLQNDDIAPRIPLLVKAMEKPSVQTLQKAIHALSQTTFVVTVTSAVLALVTPLLERSLSASSTSQEVLRQTVVVIENLTKLVHDPIEARAFLPKLQPGVSKVKDSASLPEVRQLALRALAVIDLAMAGKLGRAGIVERIGASDVVDRLDRAMKSHGKAIPAAPGAELSRLARSYVGEMVAEVVNQRRLGRIKGCIAPYLKLLLSDADATRVADDVYEYFVAEDARKFGQEVAPDDGEVEIVNATFSLGYGGMLLLSQTTLRLLKGHRYGLCGRNGCGKSTLMRSIAEGKLEGFPPPDKVRTCYVEHNQGENADISILEYCLRDPKLASEGKKRISEVLEEVGFTAGPEGRQSDRVGSLSGGWKMKLSLARAMILRADVLLLDEPTNHLDVANIKWLEDYLMAHTEITSLIVSHDSGFLDNICTDIYHYETKKLVHYRGNLAEFVKIKPEAKSYYTLSAANMQFKFPSPGILTGVKSNTRAILRMSNCTYTYPETAESGPSKPSLFDVSCHLSLSSRVAILGPNGAGKSTLLKVLTGEVIPQQGRVEKHPNLRIGYIKQHALEHVEQHMEKTPNEYLQWRYANGDDREVFLKQSRILTAEDRAQMETPVDLGDGKGPRYIEALLGRQKWKKSFQYEVKWKLMIPKFNTQVSRETLLNLGFQKLVQEFDDHESSREGLGYRILEPKVIAQHFDDCGLEADIANHNQISGLSGGQKVKVVIAGAMWNNPHLLIMDEPSNFLDRDSLGGLATAIRDFRGGVVMISHNEELVGALCPEQWHIEAGRVTHKGHLAVALDRFEDSASPSPFGSRPGSSMGNHLGSHLGSGGPPSSSNVSSAAASAAASAVNSEAEGDMKFKKRKKKKMTRAQLKDREVRRRLRHIEWLNSPKGTPKPLDTDDEAE